MQGHAHEGCPHRMLADAEVDLAAARVRRGEGVLAVQLRAGVAREVGSTADKRRKAVAARLENFLEGLSRREAGVLAEHGERGIPASRCG